MNHLHQAGEENTCVTMQSDTKFCFELLTF